MDPLTAVHRDGRCTAPLRHCGTETRRRRSILRSLLPIRPTEDRPPRTGDRLPGTDYRGPGTDYRGPRTGDPLTGWQITAKLTDRSRRQLLHHQREPHNSM
ncbi:hypothetical protein EYF80_047927 [Liparis tanakae]|uniref:Uncharacterized protein n=1 Tax=Liparis tanakae TaxID=230148 RepID=A0A4Z2FM99_9TELE|nr:hypothetical protein EYF80_047927 [Liparis tanakae]